MKTGEVAKRLGVSENTIRNWAREFIDHLSQDGAGGEGSIREFTEQDVLILATIRRESKHGLPYEKIHAVLQVGTQLEPLPPLPETNPERIKESIALVPWQDAEIEILRRQLDGLTAQFNRVIHDKEIAQQEAQVARAKVDQLYERIAELERTAGRVPELEQRIVELKEQMEHRRRGLFGSWRV